MRKIPNKNILKRK
jgi:hypothetical protein